MITYSYIKQCEKENIKIDKEDLDEYYKHCKIMLNNKDHKFYSFWLNKSLALDFTELHNEVLNE